MAGQPENRLEYMTRTPVPKLIVTLAVPTIISMLVTGIYNTADTYFVGKISTQATAAVGLVFSVMAMIQALGFFCGHGSGNYIARMLGAGRKEEAETMASSGFVLALAIGTAVAILGNEFAVQIADVLGALPSSLDDTVIYMRIILLGAPFMMGQFVLNNQLRFQGSAYFAMIGLMCGAVMNIGLDPLLIFVFDLGVAGAAIATVAGQVTSFFILILATRRGENIRLGLSKVHLNSHFLFEIVNGGAPSLFRQGLAAVATLLLNNYAGRLGGDAAIAGMSIVTRILMLVSSAMIGFGQGYQPVCSFNHGARLPGRVREGYFFCVRYATIFLAAVGAVCFLFAPEVVGIFRDDPEVIAVGAAALRFQAATLPLTACITMTNMMLQSMGRGLKASITASARSGIFFIPLILVLPRVLGILGVEITQACADVLAFALTIPLAVSELRGMREGSRESSAEPLP